MSVQKKETGRLVIMVELEDAREEGRGKEHCPSRPKQGKRKKVFYKNVGGSGRDKQEDVEKKRWWRW